MKNKRVRHILEAIFVLAVLCVVIYIFRVHSPKIITYLMDDDIAGLTTYIRNEGQYGELILIGLQAVETISIVLPALPVYICAGLLFGKLKGFLICYVTNLVLCALMFSVSRLRKIDVKNEKVESLMERMHNPMLATLCLYFVPVVPNGMIPTFASQMNISFARFMMAIAMGSFPSIFMYVFCGDALLTIDWHISIPILVIVAIGALIFFLLRKRSKVYGS